MGQEVKKVEEEAKLEEQKQEEAPAAVAEAEKKEETAAAEGEEKKNEEEAAKEPPPPVILGIDLHCTGCANKIKRCILRCKGVEGVEVDMAQNQVTVKGIVDPHGICERLRKRTMRNATVISPPPPPPPTEAEAAAAAAKEEPVVVHSQVSEVTTVELLVNMHCEACAQQLQKKILKMRGVQRADANSAAGKLTVVGTMSSDKLVQYIHRRTGKLATVVPPPPPPPPETPKEEEPKKEDGDTKPEELPAGDADKKEDQEKPAEQDAAAEGEKKEDEATAKPEDGAEKKEGGGDEEKAKPELLAVDGFPPEEMMKRMMYWPPKHYYNPQVDGEAMMARKMAMAHPYGMPMMQWTPPAPALPPPAPVAPPMMYPYYNYGMVERPAPAPQYFSDENPNACVIS